MIRAILVALLSGIVAQSPAPAAHGDTPGEGFDVASFTLSLSPDVRSQTIHGEETIALRATVDGVRQLRFSNNALTIRRAVLDGVPVHHSTQDGVLQFDLAAPLTRGRVVRLELSYKGKPSRGLMASSSGIYTSYFACDWMVCAQDRFGDKANFTLNLHVPAGMTSLSVGRLVTRRSQADGSEIHLWRTPRPYSPYLFGFAIGRFTKVEEQIRGARVTYMSDVEGPAALKRRFADVPDMVAFLAEKAGVGLPVAEYGQLLIEGYEAQEAATYSVLGTKAVPAAPGDPAEDWAIVHELAHQWWGNLVTCASLKDFWLNEGITTFMTAAWKEHHYGAAAYKAELNAARARFSAAQEKGFDKPLAWSGRYPSLVD